MVLGILVVQVAGVLHGHIVAGLWLVDAIALLDDGLLDTHVCYGGREGFTEDCVLDTGDGSEHVKRFVVLSVS